MKYKGNNPSENIPLHFLCNSSTDPGFSMRNSGGSFCGVEGGGTGVILGGIGGKLEEACTLPMTFLF